MAEAGAEVALATLQRELEEAWEHRRRAAHLRALLEANRAEGERRDPVLRELRKRLDRERADVERLESLSFTALLWMVLGRKGQRLEKELAELAAAKLKYEAGVAEAEGRKADRERLSRELTALGDIEARCAALMAQKEHLLLQTDDNRARRLRDVAERVARLRAEVKELEEAHAAGRAAQHAAGQVQHSLQKAAGWGSWDLWGGDMISSTIKHNHLDDAQQYAMVANTRVEAFRRELRDTPLSVGTVGSVGLSGFDWFFDVFLDNFFTDWSVQSRINGSCDAVGRALAQVTAATTAVGTRLGRARAELAAAEQTRTQILEGTAG